MIKKPLISVIIPSFNMASYLIDAIQSVLKQTYKPYEIILIDDGSSDNTRQVANQFHKKLSYHYQPNSGPSAARNLGIRSAKGEYLAFLDADDLWLPNKLELQADLMQKNPATKMIACGYALQDVENNVIFETIVRKNYSSHDKLYRALSIYQNIPGSTSSVMIHNECFEKVGYFDETLKIGEDWDMWLRIVKYFKTYFIEEVLVIMRTRSKKPNFRTFSNEEKYVTKVIEKSVPKESRRRAYAALYRRLGSDYLVSSDTLNAFKCILRSLFARPIYIFPLDLPDSHYPRPNRYYLLFKCMFPCLTEKVKRLVFKP